MKRKAIVEVIRWFPAEQPPTEPGFYLIRFTTGAIDTAPWNPAAQIFQHGHHDNLTHWAHPLKGPKL